MAGVAVHAPRIGQAIPFAPAEYPGWRARALYAEADSLNGAAGGDPANSGCARRDAVPRRSIRLNALRRFARWLRQESCTGENLPEKGKMETKKKPRREDALLRSRL